MKKLLIILTLFSIIQISAQQVDSPEITAAEIYEHIKYLSSDELEGRMTGTEQLRTSAEYIANEFERLGLKPVFDGSYFQEFPFISGLELGDNQLEFKQPVEVDASLNDDFVPLPFTDKTSVETELVFAGFGISASDQQYDDYDGLDVKGKVVIVFRNHPDLKTPHSPFEQFASLRYKTTLARDKGAVGIIFVNTEDKKDNDELFTPQYDGAAKIKDIAAVHAKRNLVDEFLETFMKNLSELEKQIVDNMKPASFVLSGSKVELRTEVNEVETVSWNVGAYLEGNDTKYSNEYLVIGAHFDHLGWGKQNSLYTGEPMIHNGADDNASGTTGVLELAEKFASEKENLKRGIIFFTFSGEELGLLGSNYLVNNFPIPIENVATMINMDMIGRLNGKNDLIVYGTGTSSDWKTILNEDNKDFNFNLTFNDEGFGPSDHSAFYGKKIPVLFFFTGTHTDYHKPSDDFDKINSEGQQKVLEYIYDVSNAILDKEVKPDYVSVERKDQGRMTGTRVWVGTVPDFAGDVDGYKLSGVTDGSPAAIAGLMAGDIIIKFGEKKISNIYDFTYALGDYVPGDKVKVLVLRGEEEKEFELELKSR